MIDGYKLQAGNEAAVVHRGGRRFGLEILTCVYAFSTTDVMAVVMLMSFLDSSHPVPWLTCWLCSHATLYMTKLILSCSDCMEKNHQVVVEAISGSPTLAYFFYNYNTSSGSLASNPQQGTGLVGSTTTCTENAVGSESSLSHHDHNR